MSTRPFPPNQQPGSRIDELTIDECLDLLASRPVGRVAWSGPDGPEVVPMTIALHEGAVVFRTVAYSALARAVRGSRVAVEVDDIDPATRTGWSVLVTGPAETVTEPGELAELWRQGGPDPWAPGVRTLFVRVTPRRITGRRITRR